MAGSAAKTMFGYAAPKIPGHPGNQAHQPPPAQPPQGFGAPPPQPQGAPPPQPQGFGAPPPQPQGAPPPQPQGFGAPPPQPQGFGAPPPQPQGFGAPPPQPQGLGAPPPQGFGAPPPQPQGFGAPPPQPQGFGAPPPQPQGFGAPPPQGFGAPPPQHGGPIRPQQPPPMHGGPIQPQPAPPMHGGAIRPQQPPPMHGGPQPAGGIASFAARAPQSKEGTLFGIPLATLRDPAFESKVLLIAGVLLLLGVFIPIATKPKMIFAFTKGVPKFTYLVWPIIAAACYLVVALQPQSMRDKIPPVVTKWVPWAVALVGIGVIKWGYFSFVLALMGPAASKVGLPTTAHLIIWGYPVLVFGLLATLAQRDDAIARILIVVGAGMLLPGFIEFTFDSTFKFSHKPALLTIHNLLMFVVFSIAILSSVFFLGKYAPALQPLDAFLPLVTAILLAWLVVEVVLLMLVAVVHMKAGAGGLLNGVHQLIYILGFFGVLMITSPQAYDTAKELFAGPSGYQQPHGYPQQGGYQQPHGYPQQGGYPQQPSGPIQPQMPPPQGGPIQPQMPPPQGGYPPQGGGPQGGGGWPRQ